MYLLLLLLFWLKDRAAAEPGLKEAN